MPSITLTSTLPHSCTIWLAVNGFRHKLKSDLAHIVMSVLFVIHTSGAAAPLGFRCLVQTLTFEITDLSELAFVKIKLSHGSA